jgi:hypothetical protein
MEQPKQDIKTSVNLFRILFSALSEDESLLKHLQADNSYLKVNENAPSGIYKVIDEDNNAVFKKHNNE